ncbi:MAG TPA: NTP transferase domain-containing protein [Polyangia bacterium]|jgi:choline kinase|nr:NTP transferase domain-containing protein [Polyangia bacterium]
MQAVLLAAGLGSRLGQLTERIPKALITVGDEPLLAHAVRFAARARAKEIIVVGGYGFELVASELARRALAVTLVRNDAFRDGNLVSLMAARPRVALDDELLVMNIDHIYRPAIAGLAAAPATDVTAFIDSDRALGDDDMKVERDGAGRVRKIAKTLATWDAGYVGMTKIPASASARYWATADAALAEEGRAIHVERVLARLATTNEPPACRDISGHGWLEVDLPEERQRAEEALRQGVW